MIPLFSDQLIPLDPANPAHVRAIVEIWNVACGEGLAITERFAAFNLRPTPGVTQMELLKPKFAVLDETDSGLDIDALKVVSEGVNRVRAGGEIGVVLITHTTRLLRQIPVEYVHVMWQGRIVAEGGPELAEQIEVDGYEQFTGAGVAG